MMTTTNTTMKIPITELVAKALNVSSANVGWIKKHKQNAPVATVGIRSLIIFKTLRINVIIR